MKQGQFPAVLPLASLDGQIGFKIDGEASKDYSGIVVRSGDINGDGYVDLLIGAAGHKSNTGRSYVVFGGLDLGKNGIISLSQLNGTNGFKLDGEVTGDASGWQNGINSAGDINGDGYMDLVIGAYGHNSKTGRNYVVFGGPLVGNNGLLSLSNLNGINGFKLDGEATNDQCGVSVSIVSDINEDGYSDLLLGANGHNGRTGRSYIVFGGSNVGNDGLLSLGGLNGSNGFKLDGESTYSDSGWSISGVDDINDDGVTDLLVGAFSFNNGVGRSYVVFGGSNVGNTGLLSLLSLNGDNGFKLDGELTGDSCGFSVSAAGDINADGISDLLIGANGYYNGAAGHSYVIFGAKNIGAEGLLALSTLNGTNGFRLDGEAIGDYSGYAVSAAGDINADGIMDLIIGARDYGSSTGRSYVVFGGPTIGQNGLISLSTLNGVNGFKLDGEGVNSDSGQSVRAAGDINIDGVADLIIGAHTYNNAVGRSYVVFGDAPPIIVNNSLSLYPNRTVLLTSADLAATDRNHDNQTLVFSPSGVTHGQFERISQPKIAIMSFSQQEIFNSSIQFVHDGSDLAPSYNITVRSTGIAWTGPVPADIAFTNFFLTNNQLTINQGQTLVLTTNNLSANSTDPSDSLIFLIDDLEHGQFEFTETPGQAILTFQQQNITDGQVRFVHDAGTAAPAYNVAVSNGNFTTSFQAAFIDFDTIPVLLTNRLVINQGQTVILSADILSATHPTFSDDSGLRFELSDIEQGQFSWINTPLIPLSSFYQQNMTDGLLQFSQDGSINAPAYSVLVTDGRTYSVVQAADIDFDTIPVILNNTLRINQGETVLLTGEILGATHPGMDDDDELRWDITEITQGQFSWIDFPDTPITSFYQQNITDGLVQFSHDNSTLAPAYTVSVTDGRTQSESQAADIDFDAIPVLLNNSLYLNQGDTVQITSEILSAMHPTGDDNLLMFNITDITHGQFHEVDTPLEAITLFYQQNITDGLIQFSHDNSTEIPEYTVSVTDGRMTSSPQAAAIDFDAAPILINNTLVINQGETVHLTSSSLGAIHPTGDDNDLLFTVSNVTQGQFSAIDFPEQSIESFYQQNITDQVIQFTHNNSTVPPSYRVSVSDGRITVPPATATIDFDAMPLLINNNLRINQGQTVVVTSGNLQATQPLGEDAELTFLITTVTHGNFSLLTAADVPIFSFQQQTLTAGNVQFAHDDTLQSPTYQVSVTDGRLTTPPQSAFIDFDQRPILVNNAITINQNQTLLLTSQQLSATHNGVADPDLLFHITNLTHATLEEVTFTQQAVMDGNILLVQDGGAIAPSYAVSVDDGRMQTDPALCSVTFYPQPVINTNQLFLPIGKSTILTTDNLCAQACTDTGADNLMFTVRNTPQYGQFELVNSPGKPILNFSQKQVKQSLIQFRSDGTAIAPRYQLTVTDPQSQLTSVVSSGETLLLVANYWPINQGEMLTLNPLFLNATAGEGEDSNILYTPVGDTVTHGYFALSTAPKYPIPSFQQGQVTQNQVIFVPDGSSFAPSGVMTIAGGSSNPAHGSFTCAVDFATPPQLQHAFLKIDPPDNLLLTSTNLQASDASVPAGKLMFEVSQVKNDHFAYTTDWKTPIVNFTQQSVWDGQIYFIASSTEPPAFAVSVSNGRLSCVGCPIQAQVVAPESSAASFLERDWWMVALTAFILPAGQWGLAKALKYYFGRSEHEKIDQQVTAEVLGKLWIGVCSIITRHQYEEYVGAVSQIIDDIKTTGEHKLDLRAKWAHSNPDYRKSVVAVIASEAKKELLKDRACASSRYGRFFRSFCGSEATPETIRAKSLLIAQKSQGSLKGLVAMEQKEESGAELKGIERQRSGSGSLNQPLLLAELRRNSRDQIEDYSNLQSPVQPLEASRSFPPRGIE